MEGVTLQGELWLTKLLHAILDYSNFLEIRDDLEYAVPECDNRLVVNHWRWDP